MHLSEQQRRDDENPHFAFIRGVAAGETVWLDQLSRDKWRTFLVLVSSMGEVTGPSRWEFTRDKLGMKDEDNSEGHKVLKFSAKENSI